MAEAGKPSPQTDRDLASIAEARALARRAKQAWLELAEFSQEKIDAIVDAMAAAATPQAEAFARLAVEETGYGVVEDKIQKNLFASQKVYNFIRPMKTVGVIARHEDRRVIEIAEPFGVVAAIVPTTNPTSTAIYKILIAIKARCTIVISPHPSAVKCITRVAEVMDEAARRAGAPAGRHQLDDDGDARGHAGADEAARRRGDPGDRRHGAGARGLQRRQTGVRRRPGQRAGVHRAVRRTSRRRSTTSSPARRSTTACSAPSENSVVVDEPIAEEVKREFQAQGALLPERRPRSDAVAQGADHAAAAAEPGAGRASPAVYIAEKCGITVPAGDADPGRAARRRRPRLPALDRKALPGALLLRRQGLARGVRALQADPALRRHGAHHVDPLAERPGHPRVRPAQAGVPHRRQLADDARVGRVVDRARPGDDARLRRLRRQHHVGQHLAAAPAEHQAGRLRDRAGREPLGPRRGAGAACRSAARRPRRRPAGRAGRSRRRRPASAPTPCRAGSTSSSAPAGFKPETRSDRSTRAPARRATGRRQRSRCRLRSAPTRRSISSAKRTSGSRFRPGRKLVVSERAIVTPAARDLGAKPTASSPSRRGADDANMTRQLLSLLDLLLTLPDRLLLDCLSNRAGRHVSSPRENTEPPPWGRLDRQRSPRP